MNDRHIYLVFTKTGTWLSKLIYTFSGIKYAHASISFDSSFTKMYSFGRTNPDNPFSGGFVEENLFEGVYARSLSSECMIHKVGVTAKQYDSLQEQIRSFVAERHKFRYNFLGLFGVMMNMPLYRENHYFCSQFVSKILIESKVLQSDKTPELIRTSELFEIKNREVIYEGVLNSTSRLPALRMLKV